MTTSSRALVLSGGRNAGAAWMAGIISVLEAIWPRRTSLVG